MTATAPNTGAPLPDWSEPGGALGAPGAPGAPPSPTAAPVFEVDGRPAPAPRAPPRDALREVYEELLAIERERLAVAVRIERERGFVFPETTVIVRDVRFLAEKVYGPGPADSAGEDSQRQGADTDGGEGAGELGAGLDALLDELTRDDSGLEALVEEP